MRQAQLVLISLQVFTIKYLLFAQVKSHHPAAVSFAPQPALRLAVLGAAAMVQMPFAQSVGLRPEWVNVYHLSAQPVFLKLSAQYKTVCQHDFRGSPVCGF